MTALLSARGAPPRVIAPLRGHLLLLVAPALLALVGALLASGGAPQPLGDLPGAHTGTRWLVPLAGLGVRLTSVAVLGALLVATLLPAGPVRRRVAEASRTWAAGWVAWALLAAVATAAERAGTSTSTFLLRGDVVEAVRSSRPVVGLLVAVVVALVLVRRRDAGWSAVAALPLALLGLVAPVLGSHAAAGPAPLLGVAAMGAHVIAASLWVGGLLVLLLHVRPSPEAFAAVMPRYSRWALACFVVLVVSGVTAAVLQLAASPWPWSGGWVPLLGLKVLALGTLGLAGHRHRRRTLPLLLAGRPVPFVRLAAAELALMGTALGLAGALTRTPVS